MWKRSNLRFFGFRKPPPPPHPGPNEPGQWMTWYTFFWSPKMAHRRWNPVVGVIFNRIWKTRKHRPIYEHREWKKVCKCKDKQKQDVYINMSFLCKQTSAKESSKIQSVIFSYFSICENVQIWDFLGSESLPPPPPHPGPNEPGQWMTWYTFFWSPKMAHRRWNPVVGVIFNRIWKAGKHRPIYEHREWKKVYTCKDKQKQDVYINISFLCKQTLAKESSEIQSVIFSYFSICENVQFWDFLVSESPPPHPGQNEPCQWLTCYKFFWSLHTEGVNVQWAWFSIKFGKLENIVLYKNTRNGKRFS